jgi:hypothetical protein
MPEVPSRAVKEAPLKVLGGGYGSFTGLELSGGKKIRSAVRTKENGRTIVTVTFYDGNVYILNCIKNSGNISDIKEYWNGTPLYNYGGGNSGGS